MSHAQSKEVTYPETQSELAAAVVQALPHPDDWVQFTNLDPKFMSERRARRYVVKLNENPALGVFLKKFSGRWYLSPSRHNLLISLCGPYGLPEA